MFSKTEYETWTKMLPAVTNPVPHCPALHPEVTTSGERIESPCAENGSLKKVGRLPQFTLELQGVRQRGWRQQRGNDTWHIQSESTSDSTSLVPKAVMCPAITDSDPRCLHTSKGPEGSGTKGRTKGRRNRGQNLWTPHGKPVMTIILGTRKWRSRETKIFQKILG